MAGGTPFTVPSGLLVLSVPVQAGQTVRAGDVLATFDNDEVDRAVNAKRAALQQAQMQAAQQAQAQLDRAYEETNKVYADGEESVARAQQKLDEVAAVLQKARNADVPDEEKQANIEAAQAALDAAEEALYGAQKAAESANDAALSAAQSAEDSRNAALHALEKDEEDTAKQNVLNRAASAVTAADAAILQAELDALVAIQQAGAALTAPSAGTLVELDVKPGQTTPAVAGLLAESADFTVDVPLTEDEAKLVAVGTVLHVSQSKASGDATVQSLSAPDDNGTITAKATLPQGSWGTGVANVTATIQGEKQPCVVPANAVHQSSSGYFVLEVEQKSTILGTQNVVVSLTVTVLDTGDTTTAISGAVDNTPTVIRHTAYFVAALAFALLVPYFCKACPAGSFQAVGVTFLSGRA